MRSLFLSGLGLTYWAAFRSLRRQVLGLYGSRGIVPLAARLQALRNAGQLTPTLFQFGASDRQLVRTCRIGEATGALLALGVAPRLLLAVLWPLYFSFVIAGSPFLNFQWDALLLEAGLLGMITAPSLRRSKRHDPTLAASFAFRWLAFRLTFESGMSKLQSRDPSWRGLAACRHHYQTQPLPAPTAWYVRQLPEPFHKATTLAVLALELGAPPLALLPRPLRTAGFWTLNLLQAGIAATGNFGFFNFLSTVISVWLLDDDALPARATWPRPPSRWQSALGWVWVAPLLAASAEEFAMRTSLRERWRTTRFGLTLLRSYAVSPYGLFAVMTTTRPEIEVESSLDGREWRPYEFRFKVGPLDERPKFVGLSMPRLDWQMWFAALGSRPRWFDAFVVRLLEGSPEVLGLLARDPFEGRPPRYVRARLYEYEMTSREERRRTGRWWKRESLGYYLAPVRFSAAKEEARV